MVNKFGSNKPTFGGKEQLAKIARQALNDGHIESGEDVLFVTDTASNKNLVDTFLNVAYSMDIPVQQIIIPYDPTAHSVYDYYNFTPPQALVNAMMGVDVIYLMAVGHIISWYSPFLPKILKKGRIISVYPIEDYLLRVAGASVDLKKVRKKGEIIENKFNQAKKIKVTSPAGTDVIIDRIRKGSAYHYGGEVFKAGEETSWPGGMAYAAFEEKTVNGTIVLDGAMKMFGVLEEPIKLTVEEDKIMKVEGGKQAKLFAKYIKDLNDPNFPYFIHIGLGTNAGATTTWNGGELEAVDGAIIWGIGKQFWFFETKKPMTIEDKKRAAKNHFDPTTLNGTMWLDDELILKDGRYVPKELQ